jgi:deoxyadenosine/deoxycytidine kinase
MQPFLIITSGPTGSGKSSLEKKLREVLDLPSSIELNKYIVDELVENHYEYKNNVRNFIEEINEPPDKLINNENVVDFFNNMYYQIRKNANCNIDCSEHINCDDMNDKNLADGFRNGKNIIFETTGEYFSGWLFDIFKNEIRKFKYKIIFAYCIVDIPILIERNKKRAINSIIEFTRNPDSPAPRLPNIEYDILNEKIKKINEVFNKNVLYFQCDNIYSGCNIRILIFDNNGKNYNLIYDNTKSAGNINLQ